MILSVMAFAIPVLQRRKAQAAMALVVIYQQVHSVHSVKRVVVAPVRLSLLVHLAMVAQAPTIGVMLRESVLHPVPHPSPA